VKDAEVQKLLANLQGITNTAASIAAVAAKFGVPYAKLVAAALEVAENLQKRIAEGRIVANPDDHEQVKKIITELQATNRELAKKIAKS
jgi:hypothetical protein